MRPAPPSLEAILLDEDLDAEEVLLRWWQAFRTTPPLTCGLALACLAVHLGSIALAAHLEGDSWWRLLTGLRGPEALIAAGARSAPLVQEGELWRLLSCVWVHGDHLHLLMNGVALFGLGRLCEALYGPTRLLTLFLLSGLCGSLLSQAGGTPLSVGASGSVFGLLGAGVVFGLRHRARLAPPLRQVFGRGLLPWVVLNLGIGFALPGIDNLGHLGGLLGGALLGLLLRPRVFPEARQSPVLTALLAILSWGALAWTALEMLRSAQQALR